MNEQTSIAPFDEAKAEAFGERLVGTLSEAALALMTSLGHRTGLFDTLATHVYTLASLDLFEDGAIAAFAIVAIGLIPVYILHRAIETGRPGARSSR